MSDETSIMKMAAAAAGAGAAARLALALHGGMRGWPRLAIESFVGGMLGVIACGAALYWDPALRDAGWPLLVVSGFAGLAGALGTRVLDLAEAAIRKRLG
jgi:hypothetical protein